MLASTRTTLARSGASPALRVAARRVPRARPAGARFQSTVTQQAQSAVKASEGAAGSSGSHVAAGVAGGLTVLLAGYTAYRFSSIKTAVDTAEQTKAYFQQTKDKVSASVSSTLKETSPNDALKYLRDVAKSYVFMIPGAAPYIDSTFDQLDQIAQTHGDDASKIIHSAYDEIQAVYGETKKKGTVDADAALKVADILRRRLQELYELGKRAGGDALERALENHPEVKEKLGGGYEQLRALAESKGPEAQKQLADVQARVKDIFAKGFSLEAVDEARALIQEKVEALRKIAEPAAQEAWDKAVKEAQPALEKVPEIQDYLNEKAGAFVGLGAGVLGGAGAGSAKEVFDRVRAVAEAKGKEREGQIKELKEWLEAKVKEAQESAKGGVVGKGLDSIFDYVKKLPGGDELLKKVPNAQAILALSQDKSEDAKKLAQETWEDVLKVLEEKGKKAKELGESTKEEAKDKATSDEPKGEKKDGKKEEKKESKDDKKESKEKGDKKESKEKSK